MKNDLRAQLNAALRDVDWHGEQQVLQRLRHQPVRPMRVLAVALMLLALAATALAVGLRFSGRFTAQQQARQAVMNQYGLTDEMLDLFACEMADSTFRFTAQSYADRLGEYTVTHIGSTWTAAWSHDEADANLLDSGDLASPAWGAAQLARLLPAFRQQAANWASVLDISQLTLEECAALDAPMLQAQEAGTVINIVPDEGDLPPEDALRMARSAIASKYGVTPQADGHISFFLYGQTQRREYRIDIEEYVVYVASPSGEITYCRWMVPAQRRSLPDGDLGKYPDAAEEYIASGAFDLLPAEDKASLAQRYASAGLAHLLPRGDLAAPDQYSMTESAARSMTEESLRTAYNLPEGWQELFVCRTSFTQAESHQAWVVEYLPSEPDNWHFQDYEKLGIYTCTVDAQARQPLSCSWSMEDVDTGSFTAESLAAAPAFSGPMLPWVQSLLQDLQTILDKYPSSINLNEMSLEDRGAYAQRMRQAGYSILQYPDLVPAETDLPLQQAAELAWQALSALTDTSGLTRGDADQEGLYLVQQSEGSYARVWNIVYTNSTDIFTIHVHAETGEIENIWHDSPAFSHG